MFSNSLERAEDDFGLSSFAPNVDRHANQLAARPAALTPAAPTSIPIEEYQLTFGEDQANGHRPPLPSTQEYAELRSKFARELDQTKLRQYQNAQGGGSSSGTFLGSSFQDGAPQSILNKSYEASFQHQRGVPSGAPSEAQGQKAEIHQPNHALPRRPLEASYNLTRQSFDRGSEN